MGKAKLYISFLIGFAVFMAIPMLTHAQKTVIIDAGHGGDYSGTTGYSGSQTGYHEEHANLSIAKELRAALENEGFKVYMTRDRDMHFGKPLHTDLANRMKIANDFAKANRDQTILLSIHHNANPYNIYTRGHETYYYSKSKAYDPEYPPDPIQVSYEAESQRLAHTVHPTVVNKVGMVDRGIRNNQAFYMIRNAQVPALLLEMGYMSNPQEESLIRSYSHRLKGALAIKDAVVEYYHVFEVFTKDDQRLKVYKSKSDAINYAKGQQNVYVYDKFNETKVYSNIEKAFAVVHETNGTLSKFVTESEAIDYAKARKQVNVVHVKNEEIVWSNYIDKTYQVVNSNGSLVKDFYEYETALNFAKSYSKQVSIQRKNRGDILWTNVSGKKTTKELNQEVLKGAERFHTSVEISKKLYPNGFAANKSEKTVILTTAYDFADALSVGPMAAMKDNAPILLTYSDRLVSVVESEIKRLGAEKVIIVGGSNAIEPSVENKLKGMVKEVQRIRGKNRYETNIKINQELKNVDKVFVASGQNFPDALSAAPIASANNMAIVLTKDNEIEKTSLQYLKGKKVYLVGGSSVISSSVENEIKNSVGSSNVKRLSGTDRYETLAAVLNEFQSMFNSDDLIVSTGDKFPDALAASALSVKTGSPIVLVGNNSNVLVKAALLEYGISNDVRNIYQIGGVVSSQQIQMIGNKVY
ncbi:cell wall-binding repeat-containing protein [Pseudalkalibacillus sp. Hm43]|uniref:cell wall-binding repeat-containing protein n=1 Tax=Pseudalkalibacillus sp. Hm43 TaxID=3450742 RepID=UPI003F43FF33